MGYIFYTFKVNGIPYVGELSSSTEDGDFLRFHLKECLGQESNLTGWRWEKAEWERIKTKGGKKALTKWTDAHYCDLDSMVAYISDEFDKIALTHPSSPFDKTTYKKGRFYKEFTSIMSGHDPEALIRIPEMLLITSAMVQEGEVLNSHANYLNRDLQRHLRADDIQDFYTNERLRRRELATHDLAPTIYISLPLDKVTDTMRNALSRTYKSKSADYIVVELVKESKFASLLKKHITEKSIEEITDQLERYCKKISNIEGSELTIKTIQEFIDSMQKEFQPTTVAGKKHYKQYSTFRKYMETNLFEAVQGTWNLKSDSWLNAVCDCVTYWCKTSQAYNKLKSSTSKDTAEVVAYYKKNVIGGPLSNIMADKLTSGNLMNPKNDKGFLYWRVDDWIRDCANENNFIKDVEGHIYDLSHIILTVWQRQTYGGFTTRERNGEIFLVPENLAGVDRPYLYSPTAIMTYHSKIKESGGSLKSAIQKAIVKYWEW